VAAFELDPHQSRYVSSSQAGPDDKIRRSSVLRGVRGASSLPQPRHVEKETRESGQSSNVAPCSLERVSPEKRPAIFHLQHRASIVTVAPIAVAVPRAAFLPTMYGNRTNYIPPQQMAMPAARRGPGKCNREFTAVHRTCRPHSTSPSPST
jgi:hypothetical protein